MREGNRHVLFLQVWFLWLSGEDKTVVHPIREDLQSRYMPPGVDRPRSLRGNNARHCILFGAESLLLVLLLFLWFHQLVPIGPLFHACSPVPGRSGSVRA